MACRGLTARYHSALDELLPNGGAGVQRFETAACSEDHMIHDFDDALRTHLPVTMMTLDAPYLLLHGVESFRQYSLMSVDVGKRTVSLRNPWGHQHVIDPPIRELAICYEHFEIGPSLGAKPPMVAKA